MSAAESKPVPAFFSGVLMVNSAVHLATAAAGKELLTPLAGLHSGPGLNAVWGAMNLIGGLALARRASAPGRRWGSEIHAFNAGAAAFSIWIAVSDRVMGLNADQPS